MDCFLKINNTQLPMKSCSRKNISVLLTWRLFGEEVKNSSNLLFALLASSWPLNKKTHSIDFSPKCLLLKQWPKQRAHSHQLLSHLALFHFQYNFHIVLIYNEVWLTEYATHTHSNISFTYFWKKKYEWMSHTHTKESFKHTQMHAWTHTHTLQYY